jgi:galactonate dehydratase
MISRAVAAAQVSVASSDPLAVTDWKLWRLREPVSLRRYSVLRLTTRSGLMGWGECGEVSESDVLQAKDKVMGRPATALEPIRLQLTALPGMQAAVNIALLDIAAKAGKVPLYQYLGGPTRYKIRAFTPLAGNNTGELVSALDQARQAGHRAVGIPLAPPVTGVQRKAYTNRIHEQLEALQKQAGPGFDFVLQAGGALLPADASTVAAELERFHLLWFDEPCGLRHLDILAKVSETVTPLGYGRDIYDASRFMDLLRAQVIDLLRPSLGLNGITGIRRMAAIAETYYVAVAPHHNGGPIATAAALHLAASLPNFYIQEIPLPSAERDRAMRAELAGPRIEAINAGFASLPKGDGLGVSISEQTLDRFSEARA